MSKTVMMMTAHQLSATHEPNRKPTDSRAILLLDVHKAYDTVSRDFLFDIMRYFGFADSFITMIRSFHYNTTAWFVMGHPLEYTFAVLNLH